MSAARGTSSMTKAAGERNAIDEGNALPAKIFCMRPHRSGAQVARSKKRAAVKQISLLFGRRD